MKKEKSTKNQPKHPKNDPMPKDVKTLDAESVKQDNLNCDDCR